MEGAPACPAADGGDIVGEGKCGLSPGNCTEELHPTGA